MRMLPTRMRNPQPAQVKRVVAGLQHHSAPLKGLSLSSALSTGDPMTAPILINWVLEEDRIKVRGGTRKISTPDAGFPIEMLLPYTGPTPRMLAAVRGKIHNATTGVSIATGFTSNDWAFTMFANLSAQKYLMAVNGTQGVYSYNGTTWAASVVTAPAGKTWIVPNNFHLILAHMNRLWFADPNNLSVYYLPVQTIAGEVKELPIGALLKKGGSIVAIASWSIDGGAGMDDRLVIFTSQGECVIYEGLDPDSNWQLVGIYKLDTPMSKHCVVNFGGDLYVQVSTGLIPMSVMIRAETELLGKMDKNVLSAFLDNQKYFATAGWQTVLDPTSGHVICNMPMGSKNYYRQLVRKMHVAYWVEWRNTRARCWQWLSGDLWCADDDGNVYIYDEDNLNDNGRSIYVDVQLAWSLYKSPAIKHFKMIRPFIFTDGVPRPLIDVRTDYNDRAPTNAPDTTFTAPGGIWDTATWDTDDWALGALPYSAWQGVGSIGRVGAPRLSANIFNSEFAVSGFDVIYETGSVLG